MRFTQRFRPAEIVFQHKGRVMGATSRIVAAVMIGLTVVGCALTRPAEQRREVAQRAADDSRCRGYGFKTDADLARCRMQLDLARPCARSGCAQPRQNSPV